MWKIGVYRELVIKNSTHDREGLLKIFKLDKRLIIFINYNTLSHFYYYFFSYYRLNISMFK
jgi:hypothetical protein